MNDLIKQFGQAAKDGLAEAARSHGDDQYVQGFTSSARITLRTIQKRIDTLKERMKDQRLTKAEQSIYAELDDLRSELTAGYDHFWRSTDVDWRPAEPVAKAVRLGPADDSQS